MDRGGNLARNFKSAASADSATPAKELEATTGFEPVNSGFADRRLNHLATSPHSYHESIVPTESPVAFFILC